MSLRTGSQQVTWARSGLEAPPDPSASGQVTSGQTPPPDLLSLPVKSEWDL